MIIQTNRPLRPRERHDHYPTPSGFVRAALATIPATPKVVLDHSAGTGVWLACARQCWPSAYLVGVEMQPTIPTPAADEWHCEHFEAFVLRAAYQRWQPDLIIGNPPYKHFEMFTRLSLLLLPPGGWCVQLLRLNALEGQARNEQGGLFVDHPPHTVLTSTRRISFTRNGRSDATAYALFFWQKGYTQRTYTGGWLAWEYGDTIPEDAPLRPLALLPDEQAPAWSPAPRLVQASLFAEWTDAQST